MKAGCNRVDTSLGIECPEVYLALGVIEQAFEDWDSKSKVHNDGARTRGCFWILNCDKDVNFWCELAHISPEALRSRALSLGCSTLEHFKKSIEIVLKGKEAMMVATETKARKPHMCAHCLIWIERGEVYIAETNGGGGLGDIKFPSRYHRWCHEVVKQNRNSSCVVG